MNYTLIGYSEATNGYDRYGEGYGEEGKFEILFFREEEKDKFLRQWAFDEFHSTYDRLEILINGIPTDRMEDAEWDVYEYELEAEMKPIKEIIRTEHEAAEIIRKEAAANAALQKARQIAQQQRAEDERQLKALQRKLGLTS